MNFGHILYNIIYIYVCIYTHNILYICIPKSQLRLVCEGLASACPLLFITLAIISRGLIEEYL